VPTTRWWRRFSKPPPSKTVLTDEISVRQAAEPKDEHRAAALGVEEKKLQIQFAFFLRCKIGNDGQ
jgi:hypothetical protein